MLAGAPVYLAIMQIESLASGWWLVAAAYLVLLVFALFALVDNRRIVFAILAATLVISLAFRPGVVSFKRYTIIENLPFAPTHELAARRGSRFLRTTDGELYRLLGRDLLPRAGLLAPGAPLRLEAIAGAAARSVYGIRSIGDSNAYQRYRRKMRDTWIVVPLLPVAIERYFTRNIGTAERLTGTDWRATTDEVVAELYESCCDPDWIAELIARGATPAAKSIGSRNLLHFLADRHHSRDGGAVTVRVLAEAGVAIDARDQWGKTPLFIAVDEATYSHLRDPQKARRMREFVAALLDAGANPDIADAHGTTPLLEAVTSRQYGIARLLVERGADPTIANGSGRDPITVARRALDDNSGNGQAPEIAGMLQVMRDFRR